TSAGVGKKRSEPLFEVAAGTFHEVARVVGCADHDAAAVPGVVAHRHEPGLDQSRHAFADCGFGNTKAMRKACDVGGFHVYQDGNERELASANAVAVLEQLVGSGVELGHEFVE